jgi:16S rRNA (uracil1498-N3)-methyltransferase
MAVNARFYAPDASRTGDLVALPDDEAQHLTRVLRVGEGEAVRVFNGRGDEFEAIVEEASKTGVRVRVGARQAAAAEAAVSITLAQAVLKGDKMDDVVRDAVMMGVAAIQPIITTRTEVTRAVLERGNRLERWQRIAVSSAKQCHRAVVPAVLPPCPFDDLPRNVLDLRLPNPAFMLVEPRASTGVVPLRDIDPVPPREAAVVVGPEGGWTSEEIALAGEACRFVTLGSRTLRADAMAIVALAAFLTKWNAL